MMKAQKSCILVLLTALIFFGCDDNTGSLGMDMLPDSDKITVRTDTFYIHTKSEEAGAVFARTDIGYLGKYTDPEFGFYEASFLTELYCISGLEFPKPYDAVTNRTDYSMIGDAEKSLIAAQLQLEFETFFGDSLNPFRLNVYEIDIENDKKLKKSPYTNIIPEDYYNKNKAPIGSSTFVIHDPLDTLKVINPHSIRMKLNDEIGKRFIQKNWDNPESFKDAQSFIRDVFRGIYIKNDFGDGTVLYISDVKLNIAYNVFRVDSVTGDVLKQVNGEDSIVGLYKTFVSNKEVILANRIDTDKDKLQEKINDKEHTYIKSPAGIFTSTVLPIQEISDKLDGDTLNAVKFAFTGYYQESGDNKYPMSAPSQILLIREKDKKEFFEKNLLADGITSYRAQYNGSATNQYIFSNISRLVTTCMADKEAVRKGEGSNWTAAQWKTWEEENFKILLIPVSVTTDSNSKIIGMSNDLSPRYVKLKGGENGEELMISVTSTKFH